jgi:hypothetical protein
MAKGKARSKSVTHTSVVLGGTKVYGTDYLPGGRPQLAGIPAGRAGRGMLSFGASSEPSATDLATATGSKRGKPKP